MIWEFLHWMSLAVAIIAAFVYFRDLGDVTQAFMTVHRKNMIFAIRHETTILIIALTSIVTAIATSLFAGAGTSFVLVPIALGIGIMLAFPWLWIHVGLRNQQSTADYHSIEEALPYVRPEESVIVIENKGVARAHPDYHIKRPHLAGTPEGLGGENVIMTYCCMTHLGLGYKPEIDGKPLELEVIAQHGNNLIMKDQTSSEPIQQMYGTRECDGKHAAGMQPWPTFRMSFRGFMKAFPQGQVFVNKIVPFTQNPFLCVFDNLIEAIFLWGTIPHHQTETLLFDTLDNKDDRLPGKSLVWGVTVGEEAAAFTEEFVRENDNLINAAVGGRAIVVAYDPQFESVGVYFNDFGKDVSKIDFWGQSDLGKLPRVDTLQAGAYWCVWANYFPHTSLNKANVLLGEFPQSAEAPLAHAVGG